MVRMFVKVPTFHFYRDGDKEEELYGGVFSALDVSYRPSLN